MKARLVSVIIPVFNAAEYIRQALHSALAQTYQALEVIVVDDGSTDDSAAIVEGFVKKDGRVCLVRQPNAGVGAARNTAIRIARGEFIAPLDADDIWFSDKLEKQVACMELYGQETGLVYCWSRTVDENGALLNVRLSEMLLEGRLRHALVLGNIIENASVPLFRSAALARVGLHLTRMEQGGGQGCEDWDLYLRIAESFSVRVVPEYLLAYRRTRSSMRVNAESMETSFLFTMQRARRRNPDLPPASFRWSAGYFYVHLAETCNLWGNYSGGFRYLMKAVRANRLYLLQTWIYREFIKISLNTVMGSTWKRFVHKFRRSTDNSERKASEHSGKEKEPQFFSDAIFKRIERARRAAALRDGD